MDFLLKTKINPFRKTCLPSLSWTQKAWTNPSLFVASGEYTLPAFQESSTCLIAWPASSMVSNQTIHSSKVSTEVGKVLISSLSWNTNSCAAIRTHQTPISPTIWSSYPTTYFGNLFNQPKSPGDWGRLESLFICLLIYQLYVLRST